MIIIDRYIARNYLKGMIPVMLLLLALFSLLALTEELEEVGKGSFRQIDAFLVILYTTPRRMVDLMPVTALLGGLMGLGALANNQELIAARAAGLSRARMARPVFQAALLVAIMVILAQSFLIPLSEKKVVKIRSKTLVETSVDSAGKQELWTRSGNNIVHVGGVLFNRVLKDIEIYSLNASGRMNELLLAQSATIQTGDTWLLHDVLRTRLEGMEISEEKIDSLGWTGLLSDEQANILILPLEALAPYDLVRFISHLKNNDLDTHHYRVIFWQQISIAITVVAMGLLSLPLLVGSTRSISAGQRIIEGGVIGIMFYLLQQVIGHLAGLFQLVPSVTILTPVMVLLLIAVLAQFLPGLQKSRQSRKSAEPGPQPGE
jgi:lipopolysaccharide export system permease protein